MEDKEIYKELQGYDNTHKNKYEQHWGTLLNFLDDSNLDEIAFSEIPQREEEALEEIKTDIQRPK